MKSTISILIFVATAVLVIVGTLTPGLAGWTANEGAGATYTSSSAGGAAPQQALGTLFQNVQKHDWDAAYAQLADPNQVDQASFIRDLSGSNGGLRTSSGLASWELNPLHATDSEADIRATLHWSTPVGAISTVRELKVVHAENAWKVVWPEPHFPDVPAQVIPVNYLRWDVVNPQMGGEWGIVAWTGRACASFP